MHIVNLKPVVPEGAKRIHITMEVSGLSDQEKDIIEMHCNENNFTGYSINQDEDGEHYFTLSFADKEKMHVFFDGLPEKMCWDKELIENKLKAADNKFDGTFNAIKYFIGEAKGFRTHR